MAKPIRRAPVSQMVLEEIALEGLEGITLPTLWSYLSFDLGVPLPLTSDVLNRLWNFIKRNTHQLEFYELPTDRPTIQVENRFEYKDPDFGVPIVPDPSKFIHYKYAPIEAGNILGSCEYYKERVRIEAEEVNDLSAEATYERNKLIHLGLVVSQTLSELRDDKITVTHLLNLAQYVPNIPRGVVVMVEKVYNLVKDAPDGILPVTHLRDHIPLLARKSALSSLMVTPFFQRIFEVKKATKLKKKSSAEMSYKAITLKNPEESLNDLIDEVMNEEEMHDEYDFTDAFVDNKHSFLDMPLKDEFYRAVLRHGARGASLAELADYLNETHCTARQMAKAMMRDGLVEKLTVDKGRQCVHKFVALEITLKKDEGEEHKKKTDKIAKFSELPRVQHPQGDPFPSDSAIAEIETIVRDYVSDVKHVNRTTSPRQIYRRNFIIQQLNEYGILSTIILRRKLQESEHIRGVADEICYKSLRRIIMDLKISDNLKAYEFILSFQNIKRIYHYVAHPAIDPNHPLMQYELKRLKNLLLIRKHNSDRKKSSRCLRNTRYGADKKKLMIKAPQHVLPAKPPKLLISRYMHEFLFYIVVELNEHQHMLEIDESLLQEWTNIDPALQVHEFLQSLHAGNEVQHAYTQDLNWRTFITPLPNYADKPAGWVYFSDAIDRMPLSIFNKIFQFQHDDNELLKEYLAHPVRQHYLMRQLPKDIQQLINRTNLRRICTLVLKVLHHIGLIQINDGLANLEKDSMMLWIYLNRRTHLLDTTTTEASFAKINTARKYDELKFHFTGFDDIIAYWSQVHRICVYTKLGKRTEKQNNSPCRKEFQFLPAVSFDDAPKYDTGEVPGDRAGAAGFAAFLYSHAIRNWSWVLRTNVQPQQSHARSSRITLLRNTTTSKHLRLMGVRKPRLHMTQVKRLKAVTVDGNSNTAVKHYKKKSASIRDAIDRDALNNMRTLRVVWKKEEDDLLKLSRAVYIYIGASVHTLGLTVTSRICRDVIRHNLGICNKTTISCNRRIHYITRKGRHKPEVPSWVHILQTNVAINEFYGDNFLERLKLIYPQRDDYCDALVIHFIKIFYFLYQLVHNIKGVESGNEKETSAGASAICPRFIIPNCLDEFNRLFTIHTPTSDERTIPYSNPCNEYETLTMLAIAVLHSSLCSALDKTTYAAQAFEIFKKFSEDVLQSAYYIARNGGLIVANKRKMANRVPTELTSPSYSFSHGYQRRLNFLSIPYCIYDWFYAFLENVLHILLNPKAEFMDQRSKSKSHTLSNVVELKSPNPGQLFLIAEGLSRNFWICKFKLPINILTVDAEQRQKLSAMDKILDHYHCIFENAPETEYAKDIGNESNEKQVRIKFHPANLSYKITYSPYDIISKLPPRHLHFFCALDHLDREVEINFSSLMHKDDEQDTLRIECPFNCILKQANYINAIERIVQEKSAILRELKEMPPQKLLNMALSGCSVKVETSNLLTLVRMLESFWREKELAYERKDLGRLSTNLKVNKSIDWHQLCCEILEFNSAEEEYERNDEYEPTLNKEERLARAQDVFVVNLPTLQLELNTDFRINGEETVIHNELHVPKRLMEAEIDRDVILRKIVDESHWKYTDNTLEAIKPKLNKLGFTAMEQQHVEDLLRYIESHKLGVPVTELMREFPYIQFLSRALRILSDHYLIKRVGIATMMYVHKSNIRPWVVHTFHMKRLERENLGPDGYLSLKRSAKIGEEDNDAIEDANSSKRPKLSNNSSDSTQDEPSTSKRIPKPVQRFKSENMAEKVTEKERKRDVIVMKPHAWIRLNGTINRRVLDRWMGSVLTECITRSGSVVEKICTKFPYLSPVEIMFLLEMLCELKCIHLTEIKPTKTSIFSSYEKLQENIVKDIYDPKYTYVTAHGDAITRMSIFIGNKKYSTQFF
ncbi:general transcription factor 3C polypeptide 1 isoform X2 [Eurosta solidaginis]|uniref:general transcription factor 3C polypeptide 1 isoform X2 n=1 Tax=Eurosta solidaginis TaxID=178769 RepID=UPI0035310699